MAKHEGSLPVAEGGNCQNDTFTYLGYNDKVLITFQTVERGFL